VTAANEAALRAALESAGAEFIDENFESLPSRSGKNWPLDAFLRNEPDFSARTKPAAWSPRAASSLTAMGGPEFDSERSVSRYSRIASLPPL
jgi:hypothetical protein